MSIQLDNPFTNLLTHSDSITRDELIRALRYMVSAEYDAAGLYERLSEVLPPEYKFMKSVLIDIANEELVHVGEFMELISRVSDSEFGYYDDGMNEVSSMLDNNIEST